MLDDQQRYERGCRGKIGYWTRPLAREAEHKMRRRGIPQLNVYRCQFCGWWHLGNKRGKRGTRRRRQVYS